MAASCDQIDLSQYTISRDIDINFLGCRTAFDGLTNQEKLYAHYLCQASWEGALICLLQTSSESAGIFLLLQRVFRAEEIDELRKKATGTKDGPSEEEFEVHV